MMLKGFFNRLLRIDLTRKKTVIEPLPDSILQTYLGGKGLGTFLLLKENPPGIDPFSPRNRLIFTLGPLADTPFYGSSRYAVFTKSPQTGIYSESYSGGKVTLSFSRAGYDAVIIEGRSREPIFLEISDRGVTFHSAQDLWGKETYEAEERMLREIGEKGAGALAIGPAGENLVKYAVIESERWRSLGRAGIGAVMGSKRLKGIAFHGKKRRELADRSSLIKLAQEFKERAQGHPIVSIYKKYGTPMLVSIMNTIGAFPTQYWSKGTLEGWEGISAESLLERCNVRSLACPYCFMACGKVSEVKEGRHQGLQIMGPEYETIYAFGGLCMVKSIEEIIYLNDLCDRLGMDTITAGNLVAFAIEASKRKKVREKLDYGDVDGIAEVLKKMAYQKGIGRILSQGVRHAAAVWGMEEEAIHVKGLEPAGFDPRVLKGMGLAYATSDRGACHLRATFYKSELSGQIDPNKIRGKAKLFVDYEDKMTLFDALILCRFYRDLITWEDLEAILRSACDLKLKKSGLKAMASSIIGLARSFNQQEGVTKKEDKLPHRFFREVLKETGKSIQSTDLEIMLKEYYQLRGWD
ncbi:MAG TPA: aldehyde ferredoxin oxidoreductase family protein [Thermodesulfobacteriota bacterium]|nr:aldehyde ferredoxin oxidoreductase family protein [Thermodesulfobacteriota bacterium]